MSKYVNAAYAAEKIAEKHGMRIADLCDTFGDIPAADVVEVVRCYDCIHYHPCMAELVDGSAPDWGICDRPWFNDDQHDVDEMFYCAQGERKN